MGIKLSKASLFILALCAYLLSACGTSKKTTVAKPTAPVVKTVEVPKEVVKDTLVVAEPKVQSITIALLLTLKLEEHFSNDTAPDTKPLIFQEALASLNFYD